MRNALGKRFQIKERKSSKFGAVGITDRGNELSFASSIFNRFGKQVSQKYYNNIKRRDIYITALDKYVHSEIGRAVINLIISAIFSSVPDIQGDKEAVDVVNKIMQDSNIDLNVWGADLEVHGDIFIESFTDGSDPKIASIPAQTIDIDYDEDNIIDIISFIQNLEKTGERIISPDNMTHIKINHTTNMVYGSSTLRPCFWWLDVHDNLWERNWIRAAQYYGSPMIAVTGVPSEHITSVLSTLEEKGQRPGRNLVFPEDTKIDTLDFTRNYPIELLIDRVYQYILSSCNIPQHLIYESDSSRGVAMFSGDAFEMMIKMRRKTWELGLVNVFRKIFKQTNLADPEAKLSIEWGPVFTRDLKDIAAQIKVGMEHGLYSKKSARERMQLDHSVELENLKKQKEEEPDELQNAQVSALQNKVAPAAKAKNSK